ncbi:MAG: ATP-binding protein [Synergistaceae bacterium]|nr:ATP-binding protein [Synergistaceae bacterium]
MSIHTVGAAVLDIFSSSLYKTSWSIFREYIQNSCDAIDEAVKSGLLSEGEGVINVFIDKDNRKIVIEDNATGIKADDFAKVLGSIAASGKDPSIHKGFIGIGRLIGLGCCKTVTFTAKSRDERIISKLTCEADLMRELLTGEKKFTVDDVLKQINKFSQEFTNDTESHYFIVELNEISSDHDYLLDLEGVKKSLAFVVPLPYSDNFSEFSTQIHEHAKEIGHKIDEYKIFLNEKQVFKPYNTIFPISGSDDDTIRQIQFWDIRDKNNNLFAWMWYGISSFKGVIKESCPMRGIRLRKENIQIGPDDILQKLFPEERGNHYFIGELFCVSKSLIPTTPRDYFVENGARLALEKYLRTVFENKLAKLYKIASSIRSSLKKIDELDKIIDENQMRLNEGLYHDDERKLQLEDEINKSESDIAKRKAVIDKYKSSSEIIKDIAEYVEIELNNSDKDYGKFTLTKYGKTVLNKAFGIILDELGTGTQTKQLIATIKEKLQYK